VEFLKSTPQEGLNEVACPELEGAIVKIPNATVAAAAPMLVVVSSLAAELKPRTEREQCQMRAGECKNCNPANQRTMSTALQSGAATEH
jgi:hypothetical protein